MSTNSNHKSARGIKRPDQSIEVSSFEGIIPDPETLAKLEVYAPGCTAKWMELAESEIKSRQKNEARITWTFMFSSIYGQTLGFLSSLVIFAVGAYAINLGYPNAGAAIITGSAASVIASFWFRSKRQESTQ